MSHYLLSPLQLKSLVFLQVKIDPEENFRENKEAFVPDSSEATAEDYDKLEQYVNTQHGIPPDQEGNPTDFLIQLNYKIENKAGLKAPYALDIGVIGIFECDYLEDIERRKDIVRVNGVSILFGAIREMVSTVTSRQINGEFLLPSLRFLPNGSASGSPPEKNPKKTKAISKNKNSDSPKKSVKKKKPG